MELLNLDDFRHNYVNMTGFRVVKRDQLAFKEVAQAVPSFLDASYGNGAAFPPTGNFVLTVSHQYGRVIQISMLVFAFRQMLP